MMMMMYYYFFIRWIETCIFLMIFFFLQNTHLAGNYVLKTRKTCETHIKHTSSSQNHETYRLAARNIENMV